MTVDHSNDVENLIKSEMRRGEKRRRKVEGGKKV